MLHENPDQKKKKTKRETKNLTHSSSHNAFWDCAPIWPQTRPASAEPPLRTVGRDSFLCTQVEETTFPISNPGPGVAPLPTPFLRAVNSPVQSGTGQLRGTNENLLCFLSTISKGLSQNMTSFHSHGAMALLSSIWRCQSLNALGNASHEVNPYEGLLIWKPWLLEPPTCLPLTDSLSWWGGGFWELGEKNGGEKGEWQLWVTKNPIFTTQPELAKDSHPLLWARSPSRFCWKSSINLISSHGIRRLSEFLETVKQAIYVSVWWQCGVWDMDRSQKCLKLYLSILGKPCYLKHKREMASFLLLHLGCVLVHSQVKGTDQMCDPGRIASSPRAWASFPGKQWACTRWVLRSD